MECVGVRLAAAALLLGLFSCSRDGAEPGQAASSTVERSPLRKPPPPPRKRDEGPVPVAVQNLPEPKLTRGQMTVWDPPVALERDPNASAEALPLAIVTSPRVIELLRLNADLDSFEVAWARKHQVSLRRLHRWRGQVLPVLDQTVELHLIDGYRLASVTARVAALSLSGGAPLSADAARKAASRSREIRADAPTLAITGGRVVFVFQGKCHQIHVDALTARVAEGAMTCIR